MVTGVTGGPAATGPGRRSTVDPSRVRWNDDGLVPAIVQQYDSGEVLMLAWMSRGSLAATLRSGETVFWSRSRDELWHKGATSGNTQKVITVTADCDADTLLVQVDQQGDGACHTGARTCFSPHGCQTPPDGAP